MPNVSRDKRPPARTGAASARAWTTSQLTARTQLGNVHGVRGGQGQQVFPRQGITTGAGKKCVKNTTSSMGTVGTGSHAGTYTCAAAAGVHTP